MPTQSLGTTRRQALGAALVGSSALIIPGRASAAPAAPAPRGDDVGFLSFGAVAEGVLARFYTNAQGIARAFTGAERRLLEQANTQQRANVERLNAALGPDDAVSLEDFARDIRVGSRDGALKVGRRLETLVAGVYLNGVGYAGDPGARILLGRLVAVAAGHQALLSRMAGEKLGGLPKPIDLEAAGLLLDTYLKDPTS